MAWTDKGVSFGKLEKFEEAVDCYDKAIEINPKNDLAFNNRGFILLMQGNIDDSIKNFEKH